MFEGSLRIHFLLRQPRLPLLQEADGSLREYERRLRVVLCVKSHHLLVNVLLGFGVSCAGDVLGLKTFLVVGGAAVAAALSTALATTLRLHLFRRRLVVLLICQHVLAGHVEV